MKRILRFLHNKIPKRELLIPIPKDAGSHIITRELDASKVTASDIDCGKIKWNYERGFYGDKNVQE